MIIGLHAIVYSPEAEAIRAFLRDVLDLPHVDAGHGWLIFASPPAELAVHPTEGEGSHELYLMCDDLEETMAMLASKGVSCGEIMTARWGRITRIALPDGGDLGLYQPTHPTALAL
ncbi:hypothetical protein BH09PSE1_BH09PSE1_27980 [soil metagenome]